MDTDNNQDKYICPTNGSTCQANLPYRSYIYVNITDAKGMNSYDTYEILFFNGQALIFGSQGDFFNPNQVYFSSTISKSYTGVIYGCSRQEIIGKPEFYPSGIKEDHEKGLESLMFEKFSLIFILLISQYSWKLSY
jgi:hypothetical protein